MSRKKNVLYIASYYQEDVIKQRDSKPYISQAGMNKARFMIDTLKNCGYEVFVWSNAWTNSKSFKFYKGFQSKLDENVFYSDILGVPFLNAMSCVVSGKRFIKKFLKETTIDFVVFYNMRVETAELALYIKKKFGVPVILEYEDGLESDANNSWIKRKIFENIERKVKPKLDGAILVNGLVKDRFSCRNVVIRGAVRDTVEEWKAPKGEKIKYLFASTLDEQRGIMVVLDAMKYLKDECELYITGKGPLEGLVKKTGDSRIHFLGFLDYADYEKLLAEVHACINAQKSNDLFSNVSFPSKLFEYMSAHKMIISSDVADVEEYLGSSVLIYHNDDPQELAQKMMEAKSIYNDPQSFARYTENMNRCLTDNSIEKISQQLRALMESINGEQNESI